MRKQMITLAISACLATGAAFCQDEEPQELDPVTVEGEKSERPETHMRNLHTIQFKEDDTSQLRSEPCPDYFDTDWGLVNEPGDACWNAYITSVGEENLPQAVREKMKDQTAQPKTASGSDQMAETSGQQPSSSQSRNMTVADKDCEEEDLSNQAVADNRYNDELNQREAGDKDPISDDFNPQNETAKSVAQLRDQDVEQVHLDNTFAALDDDNSGAINRVEALGVRGLADEFDDLDFNGDGVVSEAEFNLYFDGRLAGGEFICLNGERVTSLDQIGNSVSMR
ncbi:MAG: hypothetical protein R3200_12645 [Xanthomonadales bacterium]|nr:hypothetical protein [Xanthomonadales bacterium]